MRTLPLMHFVQHHDANSKGYSLHHNIPNTYIAILSLLWLEMDTYTYDVQHFTNPSLPLMFKSPKLKSE